MGVHWETGNIVIRLVGFELVQQEEGIDIIERSRGDATAEVNAGAICDALWVDNTVYGAVLGHIGYS
jgi:hypothetical protein